MKLALALILCGLSCALASPRCDDDEVKKCHVSPGPDPDHFYPETDAQMDTFCSTAIPELDCQIAFADRCPNTLTGAFREAIILYRDAFQKMCVRGTPLSQKFLEKGSCLNEEKTKAQIKCMTSVPEDEYCKRQYKVLECSQEEISRKCGSDGREVYEELFKPERANVNVFCRTE